MYTKRLLVIACLIIGLALAAGDDNNDVEDGPWTNPWFPRDPDNPTKHQDFAEEEEGGIEPLPLNADEDTLQMEESRLHESKEKWNGKWFPVPPGEDLPKESSAEAAEDHRLTNMGKPNVGEPNQICDDGMTNLQLDYDPNNITHHYRHLCVEDRKSFAPSYDVEPRLFDYIVPPAYVALHACTDQAIIYDDNIPTFGTHRQLWPVYGEYVFLPPQRWVHSLEHGAVVLLYHPCANLIQLDLVKDLVKKCLYRHVITAYELLEPERPFALVAWGRSLEFSVVDQLQVVSFIRLYGLQGPEKIFSDGQYNLTLIERANIITTPDDNVLCQNL